jgi:hypothetical protein
MPHQVYCHVKTEKRKRFLVVKEASSIKRYQAISMSTKKGKTRGERGKVGRASAADERPVTTPTAPRTLLLRSLDATPRLLRGRHT